MESQDEKKLSFRCWPLACRITRRAVALKSDSNLTGTDSPAGRARHMLRHMPERHVKLFKNGRNQALRIPREFELPGDDAIMRKAGNKLIIEAVAPRSLVALLATREPLGEEFPPIRDEPPDAVGI